MFSPKATTSYRNREMTRTANSGHVQWVKAAPEKAPGLLNARRNYLSLIPWCAAIAFAICVFTPQVEARALLHRWELDSGLRDFLYLRKC